MNNKPDSTQNSIEHVPIKNIPRNKRSIVIVLIGIIAIVLLAIGAYYASRYLIARSNAQKIEQITTQTTALVNEGKFSEAIVIWQEFLDEPLSAEAKCTATIKYANTLNNSGKYADANEVTVTVQKDCKNVSKYDVTLQFAKSYFGEGNILKAIENYEALIGMEKEMQQNPPSEFDKTKSEENVKNYEEIIANLRLNI